MQVKCAGSLSWVEIRLADYIDSHLCLSRTYINSIILSLFHLLRIYLTRSSPSTEKLQVNFRESLILILQRWHLDCLKAIVMSSLLTMCLIRRQLRIGSSHSALFKYAVTRHPIYLCQSCSYNSRQLRWKAS